VNASEGDESRLLWTPPLASGHLQPTSSHLQLHTFRLCHPVSSYTPVQSTSPHQ